MRPLAWLLAAVVGCNLMPPAPPHGPSLPPPADASCELACERLAAHCVGYKAPSERNQCVLVCHSVERPPADKSPHYTRFSPKGAACLAGASSAGDINACGEPCKG